MTLLWLANELGKSEDPSDQALAAVIADRLVERGEDFPLPQPNAETQLSLQSLAGIINERIGQQLAPRSKATDFQIAPISELEHAEDNRTSLTAAMQTVTRPLAMLFVGLVPDAEYNDRNWRAKKIGVIHKVRHEYEEELERARLEKVILVEYRQGKTYNEALSATLEITDKNKAENNASKVIADLEEGSVCSITVKPRYNSDSATLQKATEGTMLGSIIQKFSHTGFDSIRISFDSNPRITITGSDSITSRRMEYVYNANKNVFVAHNKETFEQSYAGIIMADQLRADEFLHVVNDLVSLYPAVDVRKILA